MALYEFSPSLALLHLVRTYRIADFVFPAAAVIPYKPYPPKPEHCLTFYPKDTEHVHYLNSNQHYRNKKAVLFGQQTELTNRYVGRNFLLFQIVFQPGGLYRLTEIPVGELNNSYLDAELIFGKQVHEVNEQLNEAEDYRGMVDVINSFLLGLVRKKCREIHAVDKVNRMLFQRAEMPPTVDWLASLSCLSIRQYERLFVERMGVSPGYFYNLIRFENAFRMKNKFPNLDWLTIAIHTGYYDYQHLSKAYRKFTGKTPVAFHALDMQAPERTFGVADTY